ncbi:hypothetical protein ACFLZX_04305 [Nanoarchaeota archaeon]
MAAVEFDRKEVVRDFRESVAVSAIVDELLSDPKFCGAQVFTKGNPGNAKTYLHSGNETNPNCLGDVYLTLEYSIKEFAYPLTRGQVDSVLIQSGSVSAGYAARRLSLQ